MLCALQSYDKRKKFLKKEKEREKWSQIDYRYMTEESDSDDVIRQHKLTWRSESEFNTLVLNYVLKFLYLFFQLSAVSLKNLTNAMLNNKSMGSSSSRRENFQQLQCLLHPQAIHHGLFRIYLLNIVIILVCAVRNDCFLILSFSSCKAHVYINQHHARVHAGAIRRTARVSVHL